MSWYLCGLCVGNDFNFYYFEAHEAVTEEEAIEKFKASVVEDIGISKFPGYANAYVLAKSDSMIEVIT